MLDLETCGLADAVAALRAREIGAVELLEHVLGRVEQSNGRLGAVTEVLAETARAEAARVDAARQAGEPLPQLAGVPIAVKEIIDTTPARCSSGLPFLADYVPQRDAEVVRRLRRAGAVIVGVAASDPGAFGVHTPSVQHPQAPGYNVGGSSGGSAAAVAAGFALGSLGTDTGGSIRIPAACCSLAGFKPTYGRGSLKGIRPLAWSLDHVGPIARRVRDLAPVQAVLDSRFVPPARPVPGTAWRLGHDPAYAADAAPEVRAAAERRLDELARRGHTLREIELPGPDEILDQHMVNLPSEAAAYYFDAFPDQPLGDYPPVPRETLELARRQHGYEYVQAERNRAAARRRVDRVLRDVDAILVPTLPVRAPEREAETITLAGREHPALLALIRYTCAFDQTGHPVVAMPITERDADGLSVSLQIVGRRGQDAALLGFAEELEAELGPEIGYATA